MGNVLKLISILLIVLGVLYGLTNAFGDINSKEDFWQFMKETWDIENLINEWGG